MKILRILFLAFSVGGFCSIVNAQVCCLLNFRLNVSDHKEIVLNNARIKFRGRELNYNSDQKAYYYSTLTGCNSKIIGILEVSASGFDDFTSELELNTSLLSYNLKLRAKKTRQAVVFEQLAVISGTVTDENKGAIAGTKVILRNETGRKLETLTNENGFFRLDVEDGKYSLEFIGTAGFMIKKFESVVLTKGYKYLDVVLEVRPCDDCEMIESEPVKVNKKP